MEIENLRKELAKHKIQPIKGLGQHFLLDDQLIKTQVEYAAITDRDIVLEIGPGLGSLTKELSKHARKVIAIEKDKKMATYLKTIIPDNVELITDDALEIEFPKFDKIVANLPFKISSPISFKLSEYDFQIAVLMYQKEFANRIVAVPRSSDYSRLTVNLYYKFKSEILKIVPKEAFYPSPKVDSAIVRLRPRAPPFELSSLEFYFKMVRILFNHRRKKIKNTLKNNCSVLGLSKTELRDRLEQIPYEDNRPEELTPEELGDLANILSNK